MLGSLAKAFFHVLAQSSGLKKLASRYGLRKPTSFARRFIAGETVEEAIDASRAIASRGFLLTLDYLGEGVQSLAHAEAATREYLRVVDAVVASGIERNLSIKLTQLGLDVDRATAVDNLRRILDRAQGFFVRVDMESSKYTDVTLDIFETVWGHQYRNFGVVLQAELLRTEKDLERIVALGARIRLVKGAYKEPRTVAYQRKEEVDASFIRLTERLLDVANYPAIATHDMAMIDATRRYASNHGIGRDRFEFQMLYGIRRDLQATLLAEGYRMRVYVPFGRDWFPYFMRRLGERPANAGFVARAIFHERT